VISAAARALWERVRFVSGSRIVAAATIVFGPRRAIPKPRTLRATARGFRRPEMLRQCPKRINQPLNRPAPDAPGSAPEKSTQHPAFRDRRFRFPMDELGPRGNPWRGCKSRAPRDPREKKRSACTTSMRFRKPRAVERSHPPHSSGARIQIGSGPTRTMPTPCKYRGEHTGCPCRYRKQRWMKRTPAGRKRRADEVHVLPAGSARRHRSADEFGLLPPEARCLSRAHSCAPITPSSARSDVTDAVFAGP